MLLRIIAFIFLLFTWVNAQGNDFYADMIATHKDRIIMFVVKEEMYRAVILETDPNKLDEEEIALLKRARRTVFKHFRKQAPDKPRSYWDRVRRLDPLYSPGTYVIIIENLETSEIVGNMKMVYDHKDRLLPAEKRFPGKYRRGPIHFSDTNLFNILTGRIEKYSSSPTGGAVQIMELYGPQMSAALMLMGNIVLNEHPYVDYVDGNGNVRKVRPAEIVSYGSRAEMGNYYERMGLEIVADDNGYLLNKWPIDKFKSLYESFFLYRPGIREIGKMGLLYQLSREPLRYIHVENILSNYSANSHYSNGVSDGYTNQLRSYIKDLKEYMMEYFYNPDVQIGNLNPILTNTALYFDWAIKNAKDPTPNPVRIQCQNYYK